MQNDQETAWKYAFMKKTIQDNKVTIDTSEIQYNIVGDIISLEEILQLECDVIEFEINFKFDLDIKLVQLIRWGFNISNSQMQDLLSCGAVTVLPSCQIKKRKIQQGDKVLVHINLLKKFLDTKGLESHESKEESYAQDEK